MNAVNQEINLCQSLLDEMTKLEFKPSAIAAIQSHHYFHRAQNEIGHTQRPYLVMLLSSIFLNGPEVVPSNIRVALNMAHDHKSWLVDLKLVLLPFLKANQDSFFA